MAVFSKLPSSQSIAVALERSRPLLRGMGSIRLKLNFVLSCVCGRAGRAARAGGGSPAHPAITLRLHRGLAIAAAAEHQHHLLVAQVLYQAAVQLITLLSDVDVLYLSERGRGCCGAFLFSSPLAAVTPAVVSRPRRKHGICISLPSYRPTTMCAHCKQRLHPSIPISRLRPKTDTATNCPASERAGAGRLKATPQSQTALLEHNGISTTSTARPAPCVACRQPPASSSASTTPSAASQGRDSCAIDDLRLAAACTSPRPSLYCSVSSCGRVKTFADEAWREACHWHPFAAIPASLVGDHEPKLGRRAYATGSGCPGAVGFQVVGVVLLPCIDDVQDREIEHHRRERWRHEIAYAASVSFMPSHHKCVHLARKASSFPR